jgi:hypothetical protein
VRAYVFALDAVHTGQALHQDALLQHWSWQSVSPGDSIIIYDTLTSTLQEQLDLLDPKVLHMFACQVPHLRAARVIIPSDKLSQ